MNMSFMQLTKHPDEVHEEVETLCMSICDH